MQIRPLTNTALFRVNGAVVRDPAIDAWMKKHAGETGAIAHRWFEVMRECGDEVREVLHHLAPHTLDDGGLAPEPGAVVMQSVPLKQSNKLSNVRFS